MKQETVIKSVIKSEIKSEVKSKPKMTDRILEKIPQTMSEAFMIASKHKRLEADHGMYIESMDDIDDPEVTPKLSVCAIGALFALCATKRQIYNEIDEGGDRDSMIKVICKGIKGACDPVPFEVWAKYDKSEDEQSYKPVSKNGRRWVDFAEYLFEDENKSFVQIANIFKKHGK